jgi:hypothetical protein
MTSSIGRLLQPFVHVKWGDTDLTAYKPDNGAPIQPIVHNVQISLSQEEQAPKLEFDFSESPIGFEELVKLKDEATSKPITVEIGYEQGTTFKTSYLFAGLRFSTGHDMKAHVTGVGLLKGGWTNNRISYTMDKEVPLKDFPEFLKGKCGDACSEIKVEFIGQAKDEAGKIKIKRNDIQRTPHVILSDVARANGMKVSVSDSSMDGTIIVHYPLTLADEPKKDKPKVAEKQAQAKVAERKVFVIGPGLLSTYSRDQNFNLGQNSLKPGTSQNGSMAYEQSNTKIADKDTPQAKTAESNNKKGGTTGTGTPNTGRTGTAKQSSKQDDANAALSKAITTKCNAEFFMVPYLVGIKPRDLIAIPSLKTGDANVFIEDWIVEEVSYNQSDEGAVVVSVSGMRPYTGGENILDEDTLKTVKDQIKSLNSTSAWHNFYWNFAPPSDSASSSSGAQPNPAAPTPASAGPTKLQVVPFQG